jgi:hypothetical protein
MQQVQAQLLEMQAKMQAQNQQMQEMQAQMQQKQQMQQMQQPQQEQSQQIQLEDAAGEGMGEGAGEGAGESSQMEVEGEREEQVQEVQVEEQGGDGMEVDGGQRRRLGISFLQACDTRWPILYCFLDPHAAVQPQEPSTPKRPFNLEGEENKRKLVGYCDELELYFTYEGEISGGLPNGKGRACDEEGYWSCEGNFKDGRLHGQGTLLVRSEVDPIAVDAKVDAIFENGLVACDTPFMIQAKYKPCHNSRWSGVATFTGKTEGEVAKIARPVERGRSGWLQHSLCRTVRGTMTSVADDGTSSECKGEWLVNRLWNVRATTLVLVKGSYHCEGALVYDGEWRDPFDTSREIERVEAAHAQQMQQQMQQQLEQCALMPAVPAVPVPAVPAAPASAVSAPAPAPSTSKQQVTVCMNVRVHVSCACPDSTHLTRRTLRWRWGPLRLRWPVAEAGSRACLEL